jgi:hypothetical protein
MCGRYILVQKLEIIEKRFNLSAQPGFDLKPSFMMNAYPIDPAIKNPRAVGKELLKPIGERVVPEFDAKTRQNLELQGMGSGKRFAYDPEWPWSSH